LGRICRGDSSRPIQRTLGVLRDPGDYIESRLTGVSDRRSREAVRAWRARDHHSRLKVIEAATGYSQELVAEVESVFYSEDERDWAELRSDEIPNWGSSLPVLT